MRASAPLTIAEIAPPGMAGRIGVTFAPGRAEPDGEGGVLRRDLTADLAVIAAWPARAVVTLIEAQELAALGLAGLGADVQARGMDWHHWPIRDFGVPDATFEAAWSTRSAMLRAMLGRGERVLVHCRGGLGRSGMVAARLLVEAGLSPAEAIAAVRAARSPHAVETAAQEAWVAAGAVRG